MATTSARQFQRRDTAANWTAANSVLGPGEIGVETDTGQIKVGNNTTAWTQLDYFTNATLPVANATVFGGIKVGYGLEADANGTTYIIADTGRIGMYEWEGPVHSGTLPLGKAAANNDTLTLATEILVNVKEAVTESIKLAKLQTLDTGDMLILQGVTTPGARFRFKITGTPVSYSLSGLDWIGYPVTLVDSYGSEFGDGETIVVEGVPCNVSHTHNATTDITSGTVPTARLGSGTANASTILFGNQTWGINRPASFTSGRMFDVRDYGAVADGSTDCRAAFQSALDAAVAASGGTVYVPAGANDYRMIGPAFVNGDRVRIMGDGPEVSMIRAEHGPAFVLGKEPKKWTCSASTYTDTDTSLPVNTTVGGEFIASDGRYAVDRRHFTSESGATYGAGASGNPVLEVVDSPGSFYGFRSRGVCKAIFPGNPLSNGHRSESTSELLGWEEHRAMVFDIVYYAHDAKINGGIAGCGQSTDPDPWLFRGNGTDFFFEFSVTDGSLLKRGSFRIQFAQPAALGLHRVSVQINADTGEIAVWLNRIQVAYTLHKNRGEPTALETGNVFTGEYKWFARWREADFSLGNTKNNSAQLIDSGSITDFTVVGFALWTSLKYNVSTVGSAQTRIDAATITDNITCIQTYAANTVGQNALGCLAFETGTTHTIHTWNGEGWDAKGWGMIVPGGDVTTNNYMGIENLGIEQSGPVLQGAAITLGRHLNTTIRNVSVPTGFFSAINSLDIIVCYPLFILDCNLYPAGCAIHLKNQYAMISDTSFGYVGRCVVRASGSHIVLRNFITNTLGPYCEGLVMDHVGNSISAGLIVENGLMNFEGSAAEDAPRVAIIYTEKRLYHAQGEVIVTGVAMDNGQTCPNVVLNDTDPSGAQWWRTEVKIENNQLQASKNLVVMGHDWRGTIVTTQGASMDEVVEVLDPAIFQGSDLSTNTNMKTVHRDFAAPPTFGGWVAGLHDVYPSKIPDGGVVRWGVKTSGVEGSASPPVWTPIEMAGTATTHALTGNVQPTFYVSATLDHPDITANATIWGGFSKTTKAYALFRHIFHGVTSYSRDYFQAGISKNPITLDNGFDNPRSRSVATLNNSTLWPNASSGSKTNLTSISLVGENDEIRKTKKTRSGFNLLLGANSGSMELVWTGRTSFVPAEFTNNCDLTLGIGALTLGNATRPGSWCHYMQNRILDWLFGYPSTTFPTTFYFGLSSTAIAADGTGGTEVSGGSYARQSLALNSTNFGPWDDRRSTWANKVAVTFPAPTADWGLCTYGFISDASSGGNILAKWPLNKPVRVFNGDPAPVYGIGAIQFQI